MFRSMHQMSEHVLTDADHFESGMMDAEDSL